MDAHILQPDWEPGLTVPYLPLKHLLERDIQAMLLDVDRTLLPGRDVVLPKSVINWVTDARKHLQLHLLSNNPSRHRIGEVGKQLGISFTCGAAKPRRGALRLVLEQLQCKPSQIAMVGDRVFTDVLAGNRLGLYTVLVRPLRSDGLPCKNDSVQRIERHLAKWLGA